MNTWEAVFSQSPVNDGYYNGEKLPQVHWSWPRGTWFRARLEYIREHEKAVNLKTTKKLFAADNLREM